MSVCPRTPERSNNVPYTQDRYKIDYDDKDIAFSIPSISKHKASKALSLYLTRKKIDYIFHTLKNKRSVKMESDKVPNVTFGITRL